MGKLINKEYARKCDCVGREEGTWNVPRHRVFKPYNGKIRAAFDSTSQNKATSINQKLLSGFDFINQLIGVFHRFMLKTVAFMADIQAMYN